MIVRVYLSQNSDTSAVVCCWFLHTFFYSFHICQGAKQFLMPLNLDHPCLPFPLHLSFSRICNLVQLSSKLLKYLRDKENVQTKYPQLTFLIENIHQISQITQISVGLTTLCATNHPSMMKGQRLILVYILAMLLPHMHLYRHPLPER